MYTVYDVIYIHIISSLCYKNKHCIKYIPQKDKQ